VQQGLAPRDSKPTPSVGLGVAEIRVRDSSSAFRLMYVAKFTEAVDVLHVFQKKSQQAAVCISNWPDGALPLFGELARRFEQ
jgi:phage-related protein